MSFVDERKDAVDRWVTAGFAMATTEGLTDRQMVEASMAFMCGVALVMGMPLSTIQALLGEMYERAKAARGEQ